MYLETRDIDETMRIYQSAWDRGVKTTYYLHMKPRHTAEQSTTAVNKAQKMGKIGFGALNMSSTGQEPAPQSFAAPLQKTLITETVVEKPAMVRASVPEQATINNPTPTPAPVQTAKQPQKALETTVAMAVKTGEPAVANRPSPHDIDGPEDPAGLNICYSCQ